MAYPPSPAWPPTPPAPRRRLEYLLYGLTLLLFLYGLFLPADWRECFGLFAAPIEAAARHVPGIRKVVASCSEPEYVAGVLGLAAYVPPFFALCFLWLGPDSADPGKEERLRERTGAFRGPFGPVPMTARTGVFLPALLFFVYVLPFVEPGESLRMTLEEGKGPRDIALTGRMWAVCAALTASALSVCLAYCLACLGEMFR